MYLRICVNSHRGTVFIRNVAKQYAKTRDRAVEIKSTLQLACGGYQQGKHNKEERSIEATVRQVWSHSDLSTNHIASMWILAFLHRAWKHEPSAFFTTQKPAHSTSWPWQANMLHVFGISDAFLAHRRDISHDNMWCSTFGPPLLIGHELSCLFGCPMTSTFPSWYQNLTNHQFGCPAFWQKAMIASRKSLMQLCWFDRKKSFPQEKLESGTTETDTASQTCLLPL